MVFKRYNMFIFLLIFMLNYRLFDLILFDLILFDVIFFLNNNNNISPSLPRNSWISLTWNTFWTDPWPNNQSSTTWVTFSSRSKNVWQVILRIQSWLWRWCGFRLGFFGVAKLKVTQLYYHVTQLLIAVPSILIW